MATQMAYLNGLFTPLEQAKISPMDRGFLFGDGVYEVIPVYQRRLFEWKAHLARLHHSLKATEIANPLSDLAWLDLMQKLIELHPWENQFIYLQVTRGVQFPRDHLPSRDLTPTVFAYTNPLKPIAERVLNEGLKVITVEDQRWHRCDIKAITLLPNVMAKLEGQRQMADDVILVRPDGWVTEGSASNLFMVREGVLVTPPLNELILPGITRQVILQLVQDQCLRFEERAIHVDELDLANELWLSSSTKEALPICRLNQKPVGDGIPGPVWRALRLSYQQYKQTVSTIL
jgi:D-alanine transaminase